MKSQTGDRSTGEAKPCSSSFFDRALDLAYPRKCGLCGFFSASPICSLCEGEMEELDAEICERSEGEALGGWARVFRYEGRAGQAVRRLKHNRATALAEAMSLLLWHAAERLGCAQADAFVPVPIHWTRRCLRGFNQAEMLCFGFPQDRVRTGQLVRTRATRPLAGLSPEDRRASLAGAFCCFESFDDAHVVLIDDVLTTGYTAMECAGALKAAGAATVIILSFTGA